MSTNAPEWTVSDLAGALKRTLEDSFGHVRIRGEISSYRGQHSSGHAYFCLKDQNARIDAVIWKGTFARLRVKPQEGLEVIAIGRITTFPGKSTYQIVIDSLEPAGIGALMALLEERRRALSAEGLFDEGRKRALPFLPKVIGVVTSPTGAVIRDILHRLEDRFPVRVIVWPVRVQGETSAQEVADAIAGFNALPLSGPVPRPDVLIVARGGGSIEDLWGFNEEIVVRAAAASSIPLISAVGHETDWTLIDHAADRRAPTPTGAAEMVVPVRSDLIAQVNDRSTRHREAMLRVIERGRANFRAASRALPAPERFLEGKRQRLDLAVARLGPGLTRNARDHEARLAKLQRRLAHMSPSQRLAVSRTRIQALQERLVPASFRLREAKRLQLSQMSHRLVIARETTFRAEHARIARCRELANRSVEGLNPALLSQIARKRARLFSAVQLLESLSYKSVLSRGYALVRDADGHPLRHAEAVREGAALTLQFADGSADATGGRASSKPREPKLKKSKDDQGALF